MIKLKINFELPLKKVNKITNIIWKYIKNKTNDENKKLKIRKYWQLKINIKNYIWNLNQWLAH